MARLIPAVSAQTLFLLSLGILVLVEAQLARGRTIPSVGSFHDVADFVERLAPGGAVFYDGRHNGVFTFHIRASDPEYRRQVVRSDKLFAAAPGSELDADEYETILVGCGCRWLLIESDDSSEGTADGRSLRQALGRSAFQHLRSFPVPHAGPGVRRVEVYEVREPTRSFGDVPLVIDVPDARSSETVEPIRHRESR